MDQETTTIVTAIIVAFSTLFGAALTTFTVQMAENKKWRRQRAKERYEDQRRAYAQLYAFYLQSRAILMQPKAQADADLEALFKTIGPDFCMATLSSPQGIRQLAEETSAALGRLAAGPDEPARSEALQSFDETFASLKSHMRADLKRLEAEV